MQRYARLNDLNSYYGVRLSKEFAKLGIYAWYDGSVPTSACRGGALFAAYDPIDTCLRLFPNSTRYFQTSVLANLISRKRAALLSRPLIDLCAQILPSYEGRFARELKSGVIKQYLDKEHNIAEFSLLEAQTGMFPDVLYATVPRICGLRHFREGEFLKVVLNKDEILTRARCPLTALGMAAELVSLGPGLNLSQRNVTTVFEWLREGTRLAGKKNAIAQQNMHSERILIPAFSHGLQGVTWGFFYNLNDEQKPLVRNLLQQFGQSLADAASLLRQKYFLREIETLKSNREFIEALLQLVSPVEHIVTQIDGEYRGYRLREEGEFWLGYDEVNGDEANALAQAANNDVVQLELFGSDLLIHVMPLKAFSAINSALAWVRSTNRAEKIADKPNIQIAPLQLAELDAASTTLRHQIREGYGVYVACRNLYVIDCVLRHYAAGEITLTNGRCQDFMRRILSKSDVTGYQVCGRALDKLRLDINKLLPRRLQLEPLANRAVRVSWRRESQTWIADMSNNTLSSSARADAEV